MNMKKQSREEYEKNGGKAFIVVPVVAFIGFLVYLYFSG